MTAATPDSGSPSRSARRRRSMGTCTTEAAADADGGLAFVELMPHAASTGQPPTSLEDTLMKRASIHQQIHAVTPPNDAPHEPCPHTRQHTALGRRESRVRWGEVSIQRKRAILASRRPRHCFVGPTCPCPLWRSFLFPPPNTSHCAVDVRGDMLSIDLGRAMRWSFPGHLVPGAGSELTE